MRQGQLDREITIEKIKYPPDSDPVYGRPIVSWVPLSVLPGSPEIAERFAAQVQDLLPSADEGVKMGLAQSKQQTRIRFRWRDDVDASMRVTVHGDSDVVYQITGGPAAIAGRKRMVEIICAAYSS